MTLAGRMRKTFTIEDWKTWEGRWELIGGEAYDMTPAPCLEHQRVSDRIHAAINRTLEVARRRGSPCELFSAPCDLFLGEDIVEPDMMIVCDPARKHGNGIHGAPELVVEILSPSTSTKDLTLKRRVYAAAGIPEYLIVHPLERWAQLLHMQDGRYLEDPRIGWPCRIWLLRGRLELPLGEWDPVPTTPAEITHQPYTLEDWKTWEGPWELIRGVAYDMRRSQGVSHQGVLGKVLSQIHVAVQRERPKGGTCKAFVGPLDLFLGDDVLVPDLMVVCDPARVHHDGIHGAPDLVAEILGPRTFARDLGVKREVYESAGVPEYLLIDPQDRWAQLLVLRDGSYQEGPRLFLPGRLSVLGGRLDLPLEFWDPS